MGAGASVRRSAASMDNELQRLRARELNLMEEQEKLRSLQEMKAEARVKELQSEKHDLKEKVRDLSASLQEQSDGWKREKNKTLGLMFSDLPFAMIGESASGFPSGHSALIKKFPMITMAQCDVVGFSSLSSTLQPKQLINVIDHLQSLIDEHFTSRDIFIMERTTDGFTAACGLDENIVTETADPNRALSPLSMMDSSYGSEFDFFMQDSDIAGTSRGEELMETNFLSSKYTNTSHQALSKPTETEKKQGASHYAGQLATASLKLLSNSTRINVPVSSNKQLQLRIALHSGPCSGGVVGLQMSADRVRIPHYKLFGHSVRFVNNLCRTGLALQIRVSKPCRDLLVQAEQGFRFERCPDYMAFGSKKPIESYWLLGQDGMSVKLPSLDCAMSLSEYEDIEI